MHRQRIRIDERKVYNHVLSRKCTEVIPKMIQDILFYSYWDFNL